MDRRQRAWAESADAVHTVTATATSAEEHRTFIAGSTVTGATSPAGRKAAERRHAKNKVAKRSRKRNRS